MRETKNEKKGNSEEKQYPAIPLEIWRGRDHPESVQLCLWKWDLRF